MTNNWISMHIFYASNPNPLLTEAVAPLIDELKQQRLIQHYFFIRYWQEGPHIRLRLLPTEGVKAETVTRRAEENISAYLQRKPALYNADNDYAKALYKDMFLTEYGEEQWNIQYGKDGEMPVRPNNSWHYIPYEPEYDRYGGPDGIEVAEWHFERSSDIAIRLIHETNLHVRTIMLGRSIQLSLPLCFGFLEDDTQVARFLAGYEAFWMNSYHKEAPDPTPKFEKKFSMMVAPLLRRIAEIRRYMLEEKTDTLTQCEREWLTHIRELRRRIDALFGAKKLIFQNRMHPEPFVPDNPTIAYTTLLSSYIHMMNNRLGVTILDEIYLSYIMRRSLEELIPEVARR